MEELDIAPLHDDFYNKDSSFILEIDGIPSLHMSFYITNCKGVSYLENFVGNPEMKGMVRREATKYLISFLTELAKQLGYKRLIGFGFQDKTKAYYKTLGFENTLNDVSVFCRST